MRNDNDKSIEAFEDLVAYVQENTYKLTYAVEIRGTFHLHALAMTKALGIEVDYVDLGSASDCNVVFFGCWVDILKALYSQGEEYIKSDDYISLFIFGNERNANFLDILCSCGLGRFRRYRPMAEAPMSR